MYSCAESSLGSAWEADPRDFGGQRTNPPECRCGGKCSPHSPGFKSNRSILLPAAKSSKQTRPRTLCHQQPVVCEIAGARKAASARLLEALCDVNLLPPLRNRLNIYFRR